MRKDARKVAFSLIYEYFFTQVQDDLELTQFTEKSDTDDTVFDLTESDRDYIKKIYINVINRFDEYKHKVAELAKGFKEERLFKVDLAILMMAFCELEMQDVPLAVAINEAVNLAKMYSTDNSSSFINGILAEYAKNFQK